jgi:predicted dithiol-disulfide oxidoreductase (DUF899 family)
MSELRYPNESSEYRKARDQLLEEEKALVEKVKSVAEKRRQLPPGGRLKQDYEFQWANDGKATSLHCCSTTLCMAPIGTIHVCRVRR